MVEPQPTGHGGGMDGQGVMRMSVCTYRNMMLGMVIMLLVVGDVSAGRF
jgi:hypothetical protein